MAGMAPDCIYEASVGPEPGAMFRCAEAVRAGILKMFAHDERIESRISNLFFAGNRAAWEWLYVWKEGNAEERSVRGCDLFEFSGDKIHRKSAFCKQPDECMALNLSGP
jgi:hypothetical protein